MKLFVVLGVSLFAAVALAADVDWQNEYDEDVDFRCPPGEVITKVVSDHSDKKEDRKFEFTCGLFPEMFTRCNWTNYVNDFDTPFNTNCPYNGIIRGVQSYHDNKREDRRWKYYCCESEGFYVVHCYNTPYMNNWDGHHEYSLPNDYWFHGVSGYHSDKHEDRRWQYNVCQVKTP